VATESHSSAPLFAALGDEMRLRLVARLCEGGPLSITTLTTGSRVTRQAISASSNWVTSIAAMPQNLTPNAVSPKTAVPKRISQAIIGG